MTTTPLIDRSAVKYFRREGIEFLPLGGAVTFKVGIRDGTGKDVKTLSIFVIDLSERAPTGEGLKVLIPDITTFPDYVDAASTVNEVNSRDGMVGKFVVDEERKLLFSLETVVPKESASPEHVEVALACAREAVIGFCDEFLSLRNGEDGNA